MTMIRQRWRQRNSIKSPCQAFIQRKVALTTYLTEFLTVLSFSFIINQIIFWQEKIIRQRWRQRNVIKSPCQALLIQRKVVLYFDRIFDVLHFSYEYDPDRYEGDEQDKEVVSITKSSEEASTGTVISSTNAKTGDLDKQLSLEVIISIKSPFLSSV